jgi:hypothetical protein
MFPINRHKSRRLIPYSWRPDKGAIMPVILFLPSALDWSIQPNLFSGELHLEADDGLSQ